MTKDQYNTLAMMAQVMPGPQDRASLRAALAEINRLRTALAAVEKGAYPPAKLRDRQISWYAFSLLASSPIFSALADAIAFDLQGTYPDQIAPTRDEIVEVHDRIFGEEHEEAPGEIAQIFGEHERIEALVKAWGPSRLLGEIWGILSGDSIHAESHGQHERAERFQRAADAVGNANKVIREVWPDGKYEENPDWI